jgi:phytoene dehydrogenase-like protein
MDQDYDFILIGGGHNGLTCAGYLAKAGERVIVLERRHNIGGGACTEEVTLPGFRHNLHSQMHAWIWAGPVYSDLELDKYGSKYVFPEAQIGMVFKDGRSIILYRDLDATCKQIEKFSKKDAKTYKEQYYKYKDIKEILIGTIFNPPAPPTTLYSPLEGTEDGLDFLKAVISSPKVIMDELFESEELKTLLLLMTTQAGNPSDIMGTGYLYITIVPLFHTKPWGISVGGSRMVAEAMAKMIEAHGGKVLKNSHVSRILVENGMAKGVELEDGSRFMARKAVVSNTEPQQTLLKLVGEEHLSKEFARKVKNFRWDEIVLFTPHLALNEPPKWKGYEKNPDILKCPAVGFGIEDSYELQLQFNDIREGNLPRVIGGLSITPTISDPTQAPPGKHTAFLWQYTTYNLRDEGAKRWDDIKEEFADKVIEVWREYAPNITKDNILGRYVDTPLEIERRTISMVHGSMMLGEMTPDQLNYFRPFPGWSQYRMPVKNLYLCGGSTHPCGGITGACGYNAVNIIADDFGIKKWWKR